MSNLKTSLKVSNILKTKVYDYSFFRNAVPNYSVLIPKNEQNEYSIYNTNASYGMNMVNHLKNCPTYKHIDEFLDKDLHELLNEITERRFRVFRGIWGKQTIYDIDTDKKTFSQNELQLNFTDIPYIKNEQNPLHPGLKRYYQQLDDEAVAGNDVFIDFINETSLIAASDLMHNYIYDPALIDNKNKKLEYNFYLTFHYKRHKLYDSDINDAIKDKYLNATVPEGLHRDSDCFTVLGPLVNRYNISENCGFNQFADLDKNIIKEYVMNVGESSIQDDQAYYHNITDIYFENDGTNDDNFGVRDQLVWGFKYQEPQLKRFNNNL